MYKIFVNGELTETVMYDDDYSIKEYVDIEYYGIENVTVEKVN